MFNLKTRQYRSLSDNIFARVPTQFGASSSFDADVQSVVPGSKSSRKQVASLPVKDLSSLSLDPSISTVSSGWNSSTSILKAIHHRRRFNPAGHRHASTKPLKSSNKSSIEQVTNTSQSGPETSHLLQSTLCVSLLPQISPSIDTGKSTSLSQ
jgi:hypothetical protein